MYLLLSKMQKKKDIKLEANKIILIRGNITIEEKKSINVVLKIQKEQLF